MALRREEDRDAAAILGVGALRWLDLPEAPHRGYHSAAALFAEPLPGDAIQRDLAARLGAALRELRPDWVFAPQGLGGHVDHRKVIDAVQAVSDPARTVWYRDTPYAIRNPHAAPFVAAPDLSPRPIAATLDRKLRAACAYRSQIGFQFGGPEATIAALRAFTEDERGERFSGSLNETLVQP